MTHDCAEEICEMSDDVIEKEGDAVVEVQEGDYLNLNDSFNTLYMYYAIIKLRL